MSGLPSGVERRSFGEVTGLATRGEPHGNEATDGRWRHWDPERSKVASMLAHGLKVPLAPDTTALYLGAASGTTVSHVADVVDRVYAVEFAPRPLPSLLEACDTRPSLIPLCKDARQPASYAHIVEANVDLLIQDVAARDQAAIALANRQFLAADGTLVLSIKARSEDVTKSPDDVFAAVRSTLESGYEIVETARLEPHHRDHLGIVARPKRGPS